MGDRARTVFLGRAILRNSAFRRCYVHHAVSLVANGGALTGVTATCEALWLLRYTREAAHPTRISL